ncbi:3'(2'),5'-bisphosphate nucleotidase SAL3 [Gracilaria domingensis]|nr:3'(2'),5'-bisphosphate nucleotidase SAL3 [Gracilaria domingensis]
MVSLREDLTSGASGTAWISGFLGSGLFYKTELCRSCPLSQISVNKRKIEHKPHPTSCMFRLDEELSFCLQTARQVNNIYNKIPRLQAITKSDKSPVTAVDVAIQGTVFKELSRDFSEDVFVAEEDITGLITDPIFLHEIEQLVDFRFENLRFDSSRKQSTRWWTLDPIDGTKGLLSGGDFAVGLALQHSQNRAGYPVLGSLILPRQGVLLLANVPASKLEIIPLELLDRMTDFLDARDESFKKLHDDNASMHNHQPPKEWHFSGGADFLLEGHGPWKPLCCGSLVKYAAVAQGKAFALIQKLSLGFANSWDHAAGIAAVRASGGSVTDEHGNDFAVGSEEDPRLVKLRQGSKAIVASARGINHINLCSKVRYSLRYSNR